MLTRLLASQASIDRQLIQRDDAAEVERFRANCNIPGIYRDARLPAFDLRYYGPAKKDKADTAMRTVKAYVERFREIQAETNGRGLYLTSRTKGSGKTLLACILANELIDRGIRARFIGMAQMLADIKGSYDAESGESEAEIIATATNAPVLILDDIGVERPTAWVAEIIYRLLDARIVSAKPTIFTSNTPADELKYDDRITDRIKRMAYVVELPEESVRSKIAAVEDMRMRAMLTGGNTDGP